MHRREVDTRLGMQRAQLDMVRTLAEAGVTAVLGPTTAVVVQPGAPLTVEQLLRAAGETGPATAPDAPPIAELLEAPPTGVSDDAAPTDRAPP
jgi:hypothetical protein